MVTFTATRSKPELMTPARPTPCETKTLSDLDDQFGHWCYIPVVEFFRLRGDAGRTEQGNRRPARVFRAGIAEALVYYYPMAGRLREVPGGKLAVDCAAQGVVFVAATADVRLEDLGEPLVPPYPCVQELLCEVEDASGRPILGKPLVYIQVTEFKCGGFSIGLQLNHCIADGFGLIQFGRAMIDLARGKARPVVLPVWERELLMARDPPSIEHIYPEFQPLLKSPAAAAVNDVMLSTPPEDMASRHFLFGHRDIAALRSHLPPNLARSTSGFEILAAASWRCRTSALGYARDAVVRLFFPWSARGSIPSGYYGNALMYPVLEATAGELIRGGGLGGAIEVVRRARGKVTEEYMRSTVDLLSLLRGRNLTFERAYIVSDMTRLGEDGLDFGWAERAGGGIALPSVTSFHRRCKGVAGEDLVSVSMMLPRFAMDKFTEELGLLLNGAAAEGDQSSFVHSSL